MTIQPFKNDQAVVPMVVNNAKTSSVSEVVHLQFSSSKRTSFSLPASPAAKEQLDVRLSGAATSPGKEIATQLAAIRSDVSARSQQAIAVQAASSVEQHMARMQQAMTMITKNFPPFSPGDTKRQEYLMSITSIREQILKMIVPPPPPAVPPSGMWKDLFKGIAVPHLTTSGPYEASDAQIASAYDQLAASRAVLAQRRDSIIQQTVSPFPMTSASVAVQSSVQAGKQLASTDMPLSVHLVGELQNL